MAEWHWIAIDLGLRHASAGHDSLLKTMCGVSVIQPAAGSTHAAFDDDQRYLLTPGRAICRNKARPRGDIPRVARPSPIGCGSKERRRDKHPSAW